MNVTRLAARFDAAARRHTGLLRAAQRTAWAAGIPRRDLGRGIPLARIHCGACGTVAATVEDHGRAVLVCAGRSRGTSLLGAVSCADHGRLAVTWEALEPQIAKARRQHRPVNVRATPSMP